MSIRSWNVWAAGLTVFGATLFACGGNDASSFPGCDVVLRPGEDDRTTLQNAFSEPPGEVLCLEGEFRLGDGLTLPGRAVAPNGLTLRGVGEGATLDFSEQRGGGTGANGIAGTNMARVTIEDLRRSGKSKIRMPAVLSVARLPYTSASTEFSISMPATFPCTWLLRTRMLFDWPT